MYLPSFFSNMLKTITTYIFILFALFAINVKDSHAATLKTNIKNKGFDYRVTNLKNFFEKYNSPLSIYADEFVTYADIYGIDYRLVPAISGVESTFGKHIPYKSYNAYGWANGEYKFTSWENSIDHVSMTLKTKYIDKGAPSIAKIAKRYAPPSATWGKNVKYFVSKIDVLPLSFDI